MCSCRETPSSNLGQEGTKKRGCKQWHNTMGTTEVWISHRHMESHCRWPGMLIPVSAVSQGAHKIWHPNHLPSQPRQLVHWDDDGGLSARKSADITAAACNLQQKQSVGCLWKGAVLLLRDLFGCPHRLWQMPLLGVSRVCKAVWRGVILVQLCAQTYSRLLYSAVS